MNTYVPLLQEIGLTKGEIKVYSFLLQHGPRTKTPIVLASGISGSKIYEVLERLREKGLVSETVKDGARHFDATSPLKLKDYLHHKKENIAKAESALKGILPSLLQMKKVTPLYPDISVSYGWEGLSAVYEELLERTKRRGKVYVIGASTGKNILMTELFFTRYGKKATERNIKIFVLFNTSARKYAQRIEQKIGMNYQKKFLFHKTPTEVTTSGEVTLITIFHEEPTVIKIVNKETANSFRQYFLALWELAKK
ncbi:helix-turn-helix domain-containing protein [Candidatus Woesearchaeota archaeon]|nr:helix-turn-helix domain-containing protein [Candidatus Woesearchaeota archaeon]